MMRSNPDDHGYLLYPLAKNDRSGFFRCWVTRSAGLLKRLQSIQGDIKLEERHHGKLARQAIIKDDFLWRLSQQENT